MRRRDDQRRLRLLELYCGIGGCTVATSGLADVVAAVDIHRKAIETYRLNFPHPAIVATLESLSSRTLEHWDADLWWLSPPCQPFTRRGKRRDASDRRTLSFLAILDRLREVSPDYLAIENVPGFQGSTTHSLLLDTLQRLEYSFQERILCPTAFGVPNRRRRYYLVAGKRRLDEPPPAPVNARPLHSFLDRQPREDLRVDDSRIDSYPHALHIVDPRDPSSVTSCFTSAYGHSPIRSGSYLATPTGLRRFSPTEILRLLGFPEGFQLPPALSLESAWHLVGNSLSIPAVRYTLSAIPELAALADPAESVAIS